MRKMRVTVSEKCRDYRGGENGLQLIFYRKNWLHFLLVQNGAGEGGLKLAESGKKNAELKLTEKEAKLLAIIRGMEFGEVRVVVTDGIPTRAEEIKKSVKL